MEQDKFYEQTKISDKLKAFFTLFVFIIATLLVSIIAMDLIIYPLTKFALTSKKFFTSIVKDSLLLFIILYFILRVYFRIKKLYESGFKGMALINTLAIHRLKSFVIFLTVVFFIIVSLLIIYFVLNLNTTIIHYI